MPCGVLMEVGHLHKPMLALEAKEAPVNHRNDQ
jgi:hypothetical protein